MYLTRRSELLRTCLFSLFVDSVLVVQPLVRFVDTFDQSLVCSTFCLDQWNGFLCLCFVHPFSCLCRSGTEFILSHDRLLFVIHAQIEKCSQVIRDDRRTGSRAVLLCLPTLEKRCVILAHQVLRHASCRAGFSISGVFLIASYRTDPAW